MVTLSGQRYHINSFFRFCQCLFKSLIFISPDSSDKCNGHAKEHLEGGFVTKRFPRSEIQLMGDVLDFAGGDGFEVVLFGKVLADQTICVFVGASFENRGDAILTRDLVGSGNQLGRHEPYADVAALIEQAHPKYLRPWQQGRSIVDETDRPTNRPPNRNYNADGTLASRKQATAIIESSD